MKKTMFLAFFFSVSFYTLGGKFTGEYCNKDIPRTKAFHIKQAGKTIKSFSMDISCFDSSKVTSFPTLQTTYLAKIEPAAIDNKISRNVIEFHISKLFGVDAHSCAKRFKKKQNGYNCCHESEHSSFNWRYKIKDSNLTEVYFALGVSSIDCKMISIRNQ